MPMLVSIEEVFWVMYPPYASKLDIGFYSTHYWFASLAELY
jgi:hypothetical protein